jgi:hypothetical protein
MSSGSVLTTYGMTWPWFCCISASLGVEFCTIFLIFESLVSLQIEPP